jgi:hypothetical protein
MSYYQEEPPSAGQFLLWTFVLLLWVFVLLSLKGG